jgi:hypothetical protein
MKKITFILFLLNRMKSFGDSTLPFPFFGFAVGSIPNQHKSESF